MTSILGNSIKNDDQLVNYRGYKNSVSGNGRAGKIANNVPILQLDL
jgi:hypothetical protein